MYTRKKKEEKETKPQKKIKLNKQNINQSTTQQIPLHIQKIPVKKGMQMGIKRERGMSTLHLTYSSSKYRDSSSSLKKSVTEPKVTR